MCLQLEKQLEAARMEQSKVNEETLPAEEKLKVYHSLRRKPPEFRNSLKRVWASEDLVSHLDPAAYESQTSAPGLARGVKTAHLCHWAADSDDGV